MSQNGYHLFVTNFFVKMRAAWSHSVLKKLTGEYHVFHLDRSAKSSKTTVSNYASEKTMRRHTRLSTVHVYKMCHGLLDGNWGDYLKTNRERRTRGSHDFKFIVPKGHKDIFRFSFFPRTIAEWNKLPQPISLYF